LASRGQAVSLDFICGLFIFLILIAYLLVTWDNMAEQYAGYVKNRGMELKAISLANQLVSSPGQPFNWTAAPQGAKSIGLAKKPNELDPYRVSALGSLPYADAKRLLGIESDFAVRIEAQGGAVLAAIGQMENSTRAVEVTRLALYEGEAASLKVRLYE
jgi:hypothetical protein